MFLFTITRDYFSWHYSIALVSFIRIYKNFYWFLTQFFSLRLLAGSLFLPYKQITERRGSLFDLEGWIGFLIINLLSRSIGVIARLFYIIMGVTAIVLASLLTLIWYSIWIIAPFIISYCLLTGLYLLF